MKLLIENDRLVPKLEIYKNFYSEDEYKDKIIFLYINQSMYYKNNDSIQKTPLQYGDFFIFNYETFSKYSIYPKDMHHKCEEEFKNHVLGFLYDEEQIKIMKEDIDILYLIDNSPKDYLVELYKKYVDKLDYNEKICADMYIKKLNGETYEKIMKSYPKMKGLNRTVVKRNLEKVEKISKRLKIPFVPWKLVTPGKTQVNKNVNQQKLSNEIKNQLAKIRQK